MGKTKQQQPTQLEELPQILRSVQFNKDGFQIQDQAQQKFKKKVQQEAIKKKTGKSQPQQQLLRKKQKVQQAQKEKQKLDQFDDNDYFQEEEQDNDEDYESNESQYYSIDQLGGFQQTIISEKQSLPQSQKQKSDLLSSRIKDGLDNLDLQSQKSKLIQSGNENLIESSLATSLRKRGTAKKSQLLITEKQEQQKSLSSPKKSKEIITQQRESAKVLLKKRKQDSSSKSQLLDESIKTSYYTNQDSFRWFSKAQSMIRTIKKGIKKDYQNRNIFARSLKKLNKDTLQTSIINTQNIKRSFKYFQTTQDFASNTIKLINFYVKSQETKKPLDFHLYCQLDRGSFGQVDLYFCEIEPLNINQKSNQLEVKIEEIEIESSISVQQPLKPIELKSQNYNLRSFKNKQNFASQTLELVSSQTLASSKASDEMKISEMEQNKDSLLSQTITDDKLQFIPVAGKKFANKKEFIRELYIMNQISSVYMPKILGQDLDEQIIFLELGLCNLYNLKIDSQINNYSFTDDFTFQVLINIFNAIESLLLNINSKKNSFPVFHSDIKPQNIILTASQNQQNEKPEIKLLLIDYGGASSDVKDYWSYFTPAFVCPELWDKAIEGTHKKEKLSWEQIRYAEFYAACRTIQYIIVDKSDEESFKKENNKHFINKYSVQFPKTCQIINKLYSLSDQAKLDQGFKEILQDQNIHFEQQYILKIEFDAEKIFQISKIYEVVNI